MRLADTNVLVYAVSNRTLLAGVCSHGHDVAEQCADG